MTIDRLTDAFVVTAENIKREAYTKVARQQSQCHCAEQGFQDCDHDIAYRIAAAIEKLREEK